MAEQRLYRKVADKIVELISSGAYPPGTRLPGERELAERFDVSRVVVREAEISLEALGFVEIKVGSGVYVLSRESADLNRLPHISALELTQTRLMFESESAALAATEITDDQISRLEETIERMANAERNSVEGDEADRDFHFTIAEASGNAANIFIMQHIWRMRTEIPDVKKIHSTVCESDIAQRAQEHESILDALRDRNPQKARLAMRAHFSRLLEALVIASEKQAIEEARRRSNENRQKYLNGAGQLPA